MPSSSPVPLSLLWVVVTMLSDEQLLAIHNDAANSEPLYVEDDLAAALDEYSLRGLRAVEAAVRADQIEKDAAIARDVLADHVSGYAAEITETAIRAQLTEGKSK